MKVTPAADVSDYSSAEEMLARYRAIHSAFWQELMPAPPAPPAPPETVRPPRRHRSKVPAPPPAADDPVEELPVQFAAMLRHPLSRFERIVMAVCDEFHITRHELFGRRRFAAVVVPRALTFALARHLTRKSMPDLGRRAGGFDHTTVLHAIRKLAPVLDAAADGMPEDATPAQWVRVMREYMGI
jgi:hypothetical protein